MCCTLYYKNYLGHSKVLTLSINFRNRFSTDVNPLLFAVIICCYNPSNLLSLQHIFVLVNTVQLCRSNVLYFSHNVFIYIFLNTIFFIRYFLYLSSKCYPLPGFPSENLSPLPSSLFLFYAWVSVHCAPGISGAQGSVRRRHLGPWNWSCRRLWDIL